MASDDQQDELRALVKAIHEDRAATKQKEARDGWTRYVSLMVVALAVATGIGSLKAGGFGSKVMLLQSQASDTWAFYQAKSIKQRLAETEVHSPIAELASKANADLQRYQTELKDLQAKAEGLEAARDKMAKHGPPLGFAIACLQIAIALASVCLLTKRKALWGASAVLGLVGLGYLIYGLYLV